jgi:hypothetical protein
MNVSSSPRAKDFLPDAQKALENVLEKRKIELDNDEKRGDYRKVEEKIALRKTEYRLCRQLEREELWDHLTDSVCRLAAPQVKETTLLVLDISEISKKYAKKMEYLGLVRDGSEKQLASGYRTCQVVGTEREGTTILMRHLLKAAKRVFGIPEFRFYAQADWIKEHLFARKWGFRGPNLYPHPETGQRWLFSP